MERLIDGKVYVLAPFPKEKLDPHLWMQVLSIVDVNTLQHTTLFFDDFGYGVVLVGMIDSSSKSDNGCLNEEGIDEMREHNKLDDKLISKEILDYVRILLRERWVL